MIIDKVYHVVLYQVLISYKFQKVSTAARVIIPIGVLLLESENRYSTLSVNELSSCMKCHPDVGAFNCRNFEK